MNVIYSYATGHIMFSDPSQPMGRTRGSTPYLMFAMLRIGAQLVVRVSVYEVGFEVVVEYGVRGTRREVGSNITRVTT